MTRSYLEGIFNRRGYDEAIRAAARTKDMSLVRFVKDLLNISKGRKICPVLVESKKTGRALRYVEGDAREASHRMAAKHVASRPAMVGGSMTWR